MDKIEKLCIIIIPIVYIVIDRLSEFIPALDNLTDEKGYLTVLSGLLVLIFIHFERRENETLTFDRSERIVKDLENLLEKKKHYNEINILAVTGYQYYKAFEESKVSVKKLNLLLRRSDNIGTIDLPKKVAAKQEFIDSSLKMQHEWSKLQQSGQITELNIDFYDFDTTIHFMVIDNKELFWGLLYPKINYPGTNVLAQYIVDGKSEVGEKMIVDFQNKWNYIKHFSKRSKLIDESL